MNIIINLILRLLTMIGCQIISRFLTRKNVEVVMFGCLHRLVKLTDSTKDDELLRKLEKLYFSMDEATEHEDEKVLNELKKNETDEVVKKKDAE
ncbi:hypothetical protein [Klebsiella variicola]|uniref:hypothetical protein n=1 Tax=Klebsiella variicola TaxID=244366 RepID=UPI0006690056|nr:hypothetical protein [Klebsiella variicola]ELT5800425.1 hypothetical protein [Klebsiella variicola]